MARTYIPTGKPRGRPKKQAYDAPVASPPVSEPTDTKVVRKPRGGTKPSTPQQHAINLALGTPSERAVLLVKDKVQRLAFIADWMMGAGFPEPQSGWAIQQRMKIAELFLKACGDLVPVQLNQQNNYGVPKEQEPILDLIDNGRQYDPNPQSTYEPDTDPPTVAQVVDIKG
jgi:hypothetical protein